MARTPIHPGEILAEELDELGISPTELSRQTRVPANRISHISTASAPSPVIPPFVSRTGSGRARSSG